MTMKINRPVVIAACVATAGGCLGWLIGIPVPFLLGSSLAVAMAVILGFDFRLPESLRTIAFFSLGLQAGSGVTPAALEQVALWPISFVSLMLAVLATILVTYVYLRKICGWDKQTAFFSSLPGALSFVLAAAEQTSADHRAVSVLQTIRLFLIIGLVVPVIAVLEGGRPPVLISATPPDSLYQYALLFGCGVAGAVAGHFSRLPGGMLLGALLASAALFGTSTVSVHLPAALANMGMIVLGMLIGGRFSGLDRQEIKRLFPASFFAFALGALAAAIVGFGLHLATGIGLSKITLAFVPGAMEAMTVISFILGVDPTYVAAHHVMRFLFIALTVPFIARWLGKSPND